MIAERAIQLVSIIVLNKIILDYFGVTVLGEWQYTFAMVTIFVTVSWICGNEVVVSSLNDNLGSHSDIYSSAMLIRLVGGVIASILMMVFAIFYNDNKLVLIYMAGLIFPILFREALMLGQAYFQANSKLYIVSCCLIIASIIKLVLIQLIGFLGIVELIWVPYGSELLIGAGIVFFLFKKKVKFTFSLNQELLKALAKKGFFIWFILLLQQIWLKFDRYYFQNRFDEIYYANYSSSMQLVENFYYLLLILIQIISPILLLRRNSTKKGIFLSIFMGFVSAILLAVGVMMYSDVIINLIYGDKLQLSGEILSRMIWIVPFLVVNQIINLALIGKGHIRFMMVSVIFLFFCIASLEVLFYHFVGVKGILWAIVIPLLILCFVFFLYLLTSKRFANE